MAFFRPLGVDPDEAACKQPPAKTVTYKVTVRILQNVGELRNILTGVPHDRVLFVNRAVAPGTWQPAITVAIKAHNSDALSVSTWYQVAVEHLVELDKADPGLIPEYIWANSGVRRPSAGSGAEGNKN